MQSFLPFFCSVCSILLTTDNTYSSDFKGRRTCCKKCRLEKERKWRSQRADHPRSCAICHIFMTKDNSSPSAARGRYPYCRECNRKQSREWRKKHPQHSLTWDSINRANIRKRINLLKSERPCYDCGNMVPFEAMDFDHVSGEKLFEIAQVNRPWDKIREEMDKCQLVCANCHRIRTSERRKAKKLINSLNLVQADNI